MLCLATELQLTISMAPHCCKSATIQSYQVALMRMLEDGPNNATLLRRERSRIIFPKGVNLIKQPSIVGHLGISPPHKENLKYKYIANL